MSEQISAWWLALAGSRWVRPIRWVAAFRNRKLEVVTRGLLRARLYVDGECVDARSPWVPSRRTVPLLSARIDLPDDDVWIAEVYVKGILARDVTVRINSKLIPAFPRHEDEPATVGGGR